MLSVSFFIKPRAGLQHCENVCMKAVNQSIGKVHLAPAFKQLANMQNCIKFHTESFFIN